MHQINLSTRLKEKDESNEELYLKAINSYSNEERLVFSKLLGILQISIYEFPYSDLLGKYFTEHITRGHNGQYFTPDAICEVMAKLQGADEKVNGQNVYDPACGSGRLLMNFAKVSPNNYFYANDISYTCSKMTALNFMLNGLRGEVACMNTLSMEFNAAWKVNTPTLGVLPIDKSDSVMWKEPPKKDDTKRSISHPEQKVVLGHQLKLF